MKQVLIVLLGLCALALGFSIGEWSEVGLAHKTQVIPVSVALSIRNREWLQRTVEEVSNPRHPNWRRFVTQEQLRQQLAPSEAQVNQVVEFLSQRGMMAYELSETGDYLLAGFEAQDLEKLLQVRMRQFTNTKDHRTIYRALEHYTMPAELRGLVDTFGLVSEFPAGHLRSRTSKSVVHHHGEEQQRQRRDSCVGLPNYGYPASSDSDLYSQVQIVCCNGQFTQNLTSPCYDTDYPNLVTGFAIQVSSNKTGVTAYQDNIPLSQVQSSCFLDGTSVTCAVPFTRLTQVQAYGYWNLHVALEYGSSVSQQSTFPTALITSPFVTPQVFNQYYDIPLNWKSSSSSNLQSVVEFGGQYYSPSDLTNFFGNMSLPNTPVTLVGPNDPSNPGDEATLDIEWIMAVGNGIPTTFWSLSHGYLLEWTQQLLVSQNPPLVNSVSYAGNEVTSPLAYKTKVDEQFQKLAAIGVAIVVASGDAGATDVGHGYDACQPFQPQYPASSPYVTTVSATFFTPSEDPICSISYYGKQVHCSDIKIGEVAVSADNGMDWTTGGGFSNYAPRPSWQNTQVSSYLSTYSNLLPPSSWFNATNRAYPDVSAIGHNLVLILRDQMDIGDGTSAATPIFTAILGMLNDWLLANNEAPIGFANPLLYEIAASYPEAFYDVTIGNNACGDVLHPPYIACCEYGYESSLGWDPVTGLGTPRFSGLLSALQDLVAASKQQQQQ